MDGSTIVTPARIQRSFISTRMSHSARASWARSLMPGEAPVVVHVERGHEPAVLAGEARRGP